MSYTAIVEGDSATPTFMNAIFTELDILDSNGDLSIAGALAVNGAAITTDDTTFALINTTATTVNFAGAATALNMGTALGITTIAGDLVVSGAGPHAIGGAANSTSRLGLLGSFTSSGAGTTAHGTHQTGVITGADGDTAWVVGQRWANTIVTQTATENIGIVAQAKFEEPVITDNLTGDVTIAATVHIAGAPTEGEVNAALYVASGATFLGGNLTVAGTGSHAIGTNAVSSHQLLLGGTFTSAGASTFANGFSITATIVGASGDTTRIAGSHFTAALTTQTATENVAVMAQAYFDEPTIIDNLTGDITIAATVYVSSAPTEGEANAAIYVSGGDVSTDGGTYTMLEITTPTARTNYGKLYCKADNALYFQDGAGVEHTVTIS